MAMALKVLSICVATAMMARAHKEPSVAIKDGQLKGVVGTNIDGQEFYKFFGIPYAKPPLRELRFKLAQPPEPWAGIRDAGKVGDACLSRDDFDSELVGSEDCLYLNVYTKKLPTGSLLKPVMVFIYGGGLTVGSGGPDKYGPEFLMLKDVVLVTFNYRLGVLGFLSLNDPELALPGNLGLKDQNLALKWVQENIRNFNGDANDVTIFGNSAGASSVHAHVLSPASKGLFHKAIMQSGCALNSWFWGSKGNLLQLVNKSAMPASTEREALEALKNMSALEIFALQEQIYDSPYPADQRPFSAVIEYPNTGAFISENPVKILGEGHYNQVPIMMGYTENEGMLLDLDQMAAQRVGLKIPPLNLTKVIPVNLKVPEVDLNEVTSILKGLYNAKQRYDPMTDGYFLVAIFEALKSHLKTSSNSIYLYRVSLAGELNQLKRLMNRTHEPGVCHADELGYLFRSEITPPIEAGSLEDKSLRKFVELWTNFAIFGNPTPDGALGVVWKPVKDFGEVEVLDIGEQLEIKRLPERDRLNVWWKILEKWPLVRF